MFKLIVVVLAVLAVASAGYLGAPAVGYAAGYAAPYAYSAGYAAPYAYGAHAYGAHAYGAHAYGYGLGHAYYG